ncbi:hypothetical protein F2Q68_00003169 [Brassica cretica]|uniref:Uncharacterized protein n=1 Tax=Brassica cretica TaxID=69181 RepID=A0A8S9J977_BRACR|nr:hypothetical protein F2Q68_00003169 [Brassica cretica]
MWTGELWMGEIWTGELWTRGSVIECHLPLWVFEYATLSVVLSWNRNGNMKLRDYNFLGFEEVAFLFPGGWPESREIAGF